MPKLKRFGILVASILILLSIMLYSFQEKLIFLPTKLSENHLYEFNANFNEIFLDAKDGARLNALHFYSENPKGLILYFHGNAGDLSRWGEIVLPFVDLDYDVLVMDYRNYGKSTGKLSEQALYQDAQLFYTYAKEKYEENNIIVYGRSLGTGIASQLTSKNRPQKLILETPFYSLSEIAQERFPFLPVSYLLRYKIPSYQFLKKVDCPIRIFHGTDDRVVPYKSGKKLFDSIQNEDKKIYTIPNGNHNNLIDFKEYRNAVEMELK